MSGQKATLNNNLNDKQISNDISKGIQELDGEDGHDAPDGDDGADGDDGDDQQRLPQRL
ncbi:uncharacterized protein BDZ99DRAFT_521643 [Mytilinidion resinicola]|uniref:Uncharacterized protein n=1 Tax=Mytilinidion resinicola TaxID=574789 RepID=A0A6A6YMJ8_9PEZI|nr:uncharacterized protein BDZ99DRAFT_521643 [Mytilinidion resinicola]KAF2809205.1 hypothetical protein BDZ99DRAFT_521643 [Mytilinidion resinicola]